MIGDNIRYYRKLNKLSQAELGKKLGLSRVAITSWESNRTRPNSGYVEALARIFGINKTDLIGTEYLTEREAYLVECFRHADEETKESILHLLKYQDLISERVKNENSET